MMQLTVAFCKFANAS